MTLYAGIDLHSSNCLIGVLDEKGRRLTEARVKNNLDAVEAVIAGYHDDIAGIVVESTYNWYWLVDGLMERGYQVHLANPAAVQQYKGRKHTGDRHDAYWLADMLRLDILPEGYIYPKEGRSVRDLLRVRGILVRKRSGLMTSLSNIVARNTGRRITAAEIKAVRRNRVRPYLPDDANLLRAADAIKEVIDCLGRHIREIENAVEKEAELRDSYRQLLTVPGIGKILGLTIMLETGPIDRFPSAGNYVSYCRKVPSSRISNEKLKGRGNPKNGNRYLAWAYGEAAEHARRLNDKARAYYNRKLSKSNAAVAHSALAHKLARAAYYMMKNNEEFMPERVFG